MSFACSCPVPNCPIHVLSLLDRKPAMTYDKLLAAAPAQDSPEFIEYLRKHNKVVWEVPQWLVIENAKYHKPEAPWLTAFWRGLDEGKSWRSWYDDIDILWYEYREYEWRKKDASKQSVPNRFHLHLIKSLN